MQVIFSRGWLILIIVFSQWNQYSIYCNKPLVFVFKALHCTVLCWRKYCGYYGKSCLKSPSEMISTHYEHVLERLNNINYSVWNQTRWLNLKVLLLRIQECCLDKIGQHLISRNTNSPFRWIWILTVRVYPMFFHWNWIFQNSWL